MVRVIEDNVCQDNLLCIGKKLLQVVGFYDNIYSPFDVDGRFTEDLVLHDSSARYDSPNRWWRYRFIRLFTLPFKVNYRYAGSDEVFQVKPEVWLRLNRVD